MAEVAEHPDVQLAQLVGRFRNDPLGYVKMAYPWGSGPLEHYKGPCSCQTRVLTRLGEEIRKRRFNGRDAVAPIRIAVASGHGIGKSALSGFLDNFIRSTRPHCKGTVTANTFTQLSTKTWAAIQWWNKISITGHWFESTTERMYFKGSRDSWFSSAQTSSEENTEAFAGQHAANSTSYYINDEGSGIADAIFTVEEGGLTDGEPMQFIFGNPTRPTGKLARIIDGIERGWIVMTIDSRECELTNKSQIAEWVSEYGEDSDFVRVRVRGLPPKTGSAQYFDDELVKQALSRPANHLADDALIVGVDFSWGGEDFNKIRFRRGLDARSIPPIEIPGEQTRDPEVMIGRLAEILTKEWNGKKVDMLFMDGSGIAGPVAMRLRQMNFSNIVEVNFSAQSPDPKYKNVRSMMMGRLKDSMQHGLAIDESKELYEDMKMLSVKKHVPLLFMEKDEIRKVLGRSTDDLDALALTFYMPVELPGVVEKRLQYQYERPYVPASPYS